MSIWVIVLAVALLVGVIYANHARVRAERNTEDVMREFEEAHAKIRKDREAAESEEQSQESQNDEKG